MMHRILNAMRGEAQRAGATKSLPRRGVVSAYDPAHYAAKVIIQPEGFETGFLPVGSPWVGNGWGMFCPPSPGDEVDVHFQEGGKNAAYVSLRFFGNQAQPLAAPSGEFWLVHSSGSFFKLTNDGEVTFSDASGATLVFLSDGTVALTANLIVNGSIQATGDITDNINTNSNSLAQFRTIYDEHTHGGVTGGAGNTAVPNEQI